MITFDRVTVTYADAPAPALRGVDLVVDEGELALVVGRTGVGKSTLLGAVNGLVPRFTGGTLAGRVVVDGRDTAEHRPRDLAAVVGVVGQDPLAGFVTDTVEEELAYAMEQLAVPPDVMRTRVEETLDLLGIADLRDRSVTELSGGQQQRVAIGAVLTAHPRVLVLDEPTSALDPTAAEEVLAAVTRLVHDLGVTVLMAEHRLERVVQYADRVIEVRADGTVADGPPATLLARAAVAPPVVELGRLAGWDPPPLSVRDARRRAGPLRERLARLPLPPARPISTSAPAGPATGAPSPRPVLEARGVQVAYGPVTAVRDVDLTLTPGEVVALMGRNGSGKSSLAVGAPGLGPPAGRIGRRGGSRSVRTDSGRGPATGGPRPPDPGRPPLPRLGGRRVHPGRRGGDRAGGDHPRHPRPSGPRGPRRPPSPRSLGGSAPGPRPGRAAGRGPDGHPPRRADPGPRLRGQARPGGHPRRAGRRREGGGRLHP